MRSISKRSGGSSHSSRGSLNTREFVAAVRDSIRFTALVTAPFMGRTCSSALHAWNQYVRRYTHTSLPGPDCLLFQTQGIKGL